jgi:hypothetical protein
MSDMEIYQKLEALRDNYLNEAVIPKNSEYMISGKAYEQKIWSESYQKDELIVFQLESKNIIGSSVFCLGLKRSEAGKIEKLSNSQLWDIGIP